MVRRQGDGQQAELQPGSAAAEAEAGVLAHLRPDRREALERLQAQPVLDRLVEVRAEGAAA